MRFFARQYRAFQSKPERNSVDRFLIKEEIRLVGECDILDISHLHACQSILCYILKRISQADNRRKHQIYLLFNFHNRCQAFGDSSQREISMSKQSASVGIAIEEDYVGIDETYKREKDFI